MDDSALWFLPAMFLLNAMQGFAESRTRLNLVFSALFALAAVYLVITFAAAGGRPSVGLALVTAAGVMFIAVTAIRRSIAGLDVFIGPERSLRGASAVARVRGRLNRTLRRSPDAPVADVGGRHLGDVLLAAAREAGSGDLHAAVNRLDTALSPAEAPLSWPNARLGLMLYHRTVYSALATVLGDSPAESTRWRNDLDLARTVLPDVRLGWLADAAVAVAEQRLWTAVYATDALLRDPRGPWEKGLGAVVGRLARDVPDAYREGRHARLIDRNPWVTRLATRLQRVAAPG